MMLYFITYKEKEKISGNDMDGKHKIRTIS